MTLRKILSLLIAMIMALGCVGIPAMAEETAAVAKVGDTEYATIDEAIAAWTNGTTLTLLSDVTLSDVIELSSTEYHILDLGTYTMTAASGKDAIQYVVNGRSSASYALDIKADATNPGGITATGKTVVSHIKPSSDAPSKDRPITRFYGGIFNASYVVKQGGTSSWGFLTSGYTGASAPYFQFYGGEYNGTIYTNRSQNQFYGGTFNGSMQMSVDSSAYTLVAGGTFKNLSNSMGSTLTSEKFVIGTEKGANDGSVCVDENGYYVISTTTPAEAEASVASNYNSNNYFYYSTVNTNGMYYEDVYDAIESNTTGVVTVFADELDLSDTTFEGTIVVPEGEEITIIVEEGVTPTWTVDAGEDAVIYTDNTGNVLEKDESGSFAVPDSAETNEDVIVEGVDVEITPVEGEDNSYDITLAEGATWTEGTSVTMTFPAVEGASDGDSAYVVHEHEDGTYIYVSNVENGSVTIENTTGFSTFTVYEGGFDDALAEANTCTDDVTVEIYGKVEYTDATPNLTGAYNTINFVGKTDDAEISITRNGSNGYICGNANGTPNVTFSDLILSKPVGSFAADAGFMNVYFTVYRAGTVTYTNCTFPDGACAAGSTVTYTDCTFANQTSGEYSLWVYANADVTVDGGSFTGVRGVKMYTESNTVDDAGTLSLEGVTFTDSVTQKPAIVLTYGESVTLENNTYSSTGVFELDLDGAPNGTTVTSDVAPTCVNDDGACGVLVDGKIYTTVAEAVAVAEAGDTVTLLYSTDETATFAEGVTLTLADGVEAENVTVKTTITTISTVEDLIAFANAVNSGDDYAGKTVTLTADLILTDAWTSIGNGSRSGSSYTGNSFAGTFDGGDHTISGLTAPLFGIVTGTVKDVNLVADINDTTNDSVGAAVAVLVGGTVDDADVSGTVTATKAAGGVVGRVLAIGEVKNCDNTAAVTSTGSSDAAGGIVGKAYYTSTSGVMNITDCTNTGAINGGYAAGGIVGFSAANVSNCINSGTVNSTGIEAGGIVGEQTNYGTVSGNENSANVTGGIAGGIVGWVRYQNNSSAYPLTETVVISDNTNTGSIASGTDISSLSCAGGIVGNIYNQATVTGNTNKAATISAATFAAGIVGALQPTNDNVDIDGATFTVTGNTTTTTAENITANCTDLVAYNNVGSDATIENNTVPSDVAYVAQIGDVKYTDLQTAIDTAQDGDVVTIFAGEYSSINISNKNITIQGTIGDDGELLTTIKGGNPAITGHSFNGTIKDIKIVDAWKVMYAEPAGNVTVDNVYVTGATYGFHLIAYSEDLTWTIQNSYMDLAWANSFGVYGDGDAAIIIKGNEFVSTDPYYEDYGAIHVNSFLPNVTIEENIFGENAKIYIDESVTDSSKLNISKNYHADGVDNAFANDSGVTVYINEYYSDAEKTQLVQRYVQINDTYFATLAEAATAANSGDEIILLADLAEDVTVPAGVIFNGNGKQVGTITAAGEITFKGHTKATNFGTQYTNTTINIGEGACLEITGTGRLVVGHGCTFNITGSIADAKTVNTEELTASIIAPGASLTGAGVNFNVTNAYVKFTAYCSSKNSNASDTFNINVTNSIWEQTGSLVFSEPTNEKDPTFNFNVKDSVLNSTSHLVFAVTKGEIVFDNSNVNVGTSRQIENRSTMTIKNGSVVNGAVATSSNAKNPGTLIIENATYSVTGEFSGSDVGTGTIVIKDGASFTAGKITNANIQIDAANMSAGDEINLTADLSGLTGAVEVINNDSLVAEIVDGKIVLSAKPVPTGTVTPAYTSATTIWGEATGNASESFAIRLYSGETLLVTATLNDPEGVIIDGNIENVTWNIPLNNAGNDSWWNVEWTNYITADTQPTKVVAVVDGVEVAENTYKLCAPDNLNKIYAAVADADGNFTAYYTDLQEAIAVANAGDTITLLDDVSLDEAIVIEKDDTITLDLNGKEIVYTSTTQGEAMITNKGNLTINDSVGSGVINYNYTGEADSTYGKGNYTISNGGTLTVNGGKITIANISRHAKYPIDNNSTSGDAVLVINGGHLYNYNTSAIRQFCNSTEYENSVTINGGVIEGYSAIWVQNPGSKTVNGELIITGGEIKSTAKAYVEGTAELKDVGSEIYFTIDGEGGAWSETSAVTITGGTFNENIYLATEAPAISVDEEKATFNGRLELPVENVAEVNGVGYETLQAALDAAAAGTGNITVEILSDINLSGVDWNPVTVSGSGYPVVTVNGNEKTITGLNNMLFAGTWAGGSGLIINDLTIAESTIVNDKDDANGTVGVGAFIGFPQASAVITLNNCHLVNSTVEGGHWTGGLIGYAAGYAGTDGPVFMNLTITGCSVTDSDIIGKGSAGGVIGHGSGNGWTNVVIENTTVSGNTIKSTGSSDNKAGAVMGTIGAAGQPTTTNGITKIGGASVSATVSGNIVISNGTTITTIYGRQGTSTGMLYVTGGNYDNYPIEENVSYAKPAEGYEIVQNENGTFGVVEKADLFEFYGASPILGNSLAIDFAIDKSNFDGEGYYAEIEHDTANGVVKTTIPMDNWTTNGGYYVINYSNITAKQIAETMYITIYDENGNQVSERREDGVKAYAERMLVKDGTSDKLKTTLVDLLNYGAAAQKQFEYRTDMLANAGLTDEQKAYASEMPEIADEREYEADKCAGSSLVLKDNIRLEVAFAGITEGMTATATYIKHNATEAKTYNFAYEDFTTNGSYKVLTVDTLVIADAKQLVTITVYNKDGSVYTTYKDSMNSYLARQLEKGEAASGIYTMTAKFTASAYNSLH